ncbi:MAG: hypothetical protein RIC56_08840 [Pseudomonadales bacterium]
MIERPAVRIAGWLLLAAALSLFRPLAVAAGVDVDRRLAECAALSAPSDRLACFESIAADRAAARTAGAAPQPPRPAQPVPAPPAAPEPAAPRPAVPQPGVAKPAPLEDPDASFGAEMLERPADVRDRGASQISADIDRVEARTHGERIFHLTNGQVWEELEAGRGRYRSGQSITIRRALLGGYMLEADGVPAARVRRIR